MTGTDHKSAATAMPWPRAAASAAVLRDGEVLLVERGKGRRTGLWSLPGGHIEPGETAAAAALREVREETGISAAIAGLAGVHDVIRHGRDGALSVHYLLAVYAARWVAGRPTAASDSRDARFVPIERLADYRLTDGAEDLIRRAAAIVGGGAEM